MRPKSGALELTWSEQPGSSPTVPRAPREFGSFSRGWAGSGAQLGLGGTKGGRKGDEGYPEQKCSPGEPGSSLKSWVCGVNHFGHRITCALRDGRETNFQADRAFRLVVSRPTLAHAHPWPQGVMRMHLRSRRRSRRRRRSRPRSRGECRLWWQGSDLRAVYSGPPGRNLEPSRSQPGTSPDLPDCSGLRAPGRDRRNVNNKAGAPPAWAASIASVTRCQYCGVLRCETRHARGDTTRQGNARCKIQKVLSRATQTRLLELCLRDPTRPQAGSMREAVRNRHRTHPSDRTVPQGRLHLPSSCNPGDPETPLWLVLNVDGDGTGIAFALLARVIGSAVESPRKIGSS